MIIVCGMTFQFTFLNKCVQLVFSYRYFYDYGKVLSISILVTSMFFQNQHGINMPLTLKLTINISIECVNYRKSNRYG